MSVDIRVSYESDGELLAVTERLADLPLKISAKEYTSGRFRRVYLRGEALEGGAKAAERISPCPPAKAAGRAVATPQATPEN